MADTLYHYPGAQPFRDNEFAQRTFFGRGPAAIALADQILANRLVVLYAKSGVGKTSLLNAGVAPRLRDAGNIPLLARVNDLTRDLLTSIMDEVRAEAARQGVEYVAGDSSTLWSFFKTVQFWRGDLLLTPVLILDQFEELFTLQSDEAREKFLDELSYLVRGVAPAAASDSSLSDKPPQIQVVLSLREDFLGLLEEASARIPQILDHRFRLAPLDREAAAEAILRPTQINQSGFATSPFSLQPDVVPAILNCVTRSASARHGLGTRYVEPFHLQLICQRIERIVAAKQKLAQGPVEFALKDLGGEAALAETLSDFYGDAIRSLPRRGQRAAARRMCQEYLISPEGRRLSVDEHELQSQLKLPPAALLQLVDRRLLRTDRRAESTYFELSHDALIHPILASRRMQALLISWATLLSGLFVLLFAAFWVIVIIYYLVTQKKIGSADVVVAVALAIAAAALAAVSVRWLRSGIRTRRRYRRRSAAGPGEDAPRPQPLPRKLLGWATLLAGSALGIVCIIVVVLIVVALAGYAFHHGQLPHGLGWLQDLVGEDDWRLARDHPLSELGWFVVEIGTLFAFGWLLFRVGKRLLWPHEASLPLKTWWRPALDSPPSPLTIQLRMIAGAAGLVLVVTLAVTLRRCVTTTQGELPRWMSNFFVGLDLSDACRNVHQSRLWSTDPFIFIFLLAAFVFSVIFLSSGVVGIRNTGRYRRSRFMPEGTAKSAGRENPV